MATRTKLWGRLLTALMFTTTLMVGPTPHAFIAAAARCASGGSGPGIPAPADARSGTPGFHARWFGQSGYPTLCPGERSTATVAYLNSGSLGWVAGQMGETAYLGTWGPDPGQDQSSPLGGDGSSGSPNTGWPRANRLALQPAPYVGPGQVAWFQFTIQAPATAGFYRLYLRPLVEGATWLEDFGVFWLITVLNADGSAPSPAVADVGYTERNVDTSLGTFGVHLIKAPLAEVTVRTMTANTADCADACPVKPLAQYVAENGAFAGMNGTYLCPPAYASCAGKVNSYDYAVYNSALGRWLNRSALVGQNGLVTFAGGRPTFYRRSYVYAQSAVSQSPITAGITMFPLLLQNGAIVDSESEQTAQQRLRGTKGSIGSDGTYVYLTLVSNATMTEVAYVLQALGVRDALNLDGGGTSAMYTDGAYRVGPGRLLPNAILLTRS